MRNTQAPATGWSFSDLPQGWGDFKPVEVKPRKRPKPQRTQGSKVISKKESNQIIGRFLEVLDCPRALSVWILFRSTRDHRQLAELTCKVDDYGSLDSFKVAYAATKLLSKCADLRTGLDTKEVALASAAKAELKNRETNCRLRAFRSGSVRTSTMESRFGKAREIVAKILGPVPDADFVLSDHPKSVDPSYEYLATVAGFEDGGWSSGRTTSSSGDQLATVRKYMSSADTTMSARSASMRLLRANPRWADLHPQGVRTVRGNVMLVVPKNAKTDRVICYEPHMNIRLQLAIGSYMKMRLKRFGINLMDQSINQRRATVGSLHGHLATLDLKAASDTLAYELVWELLPIDWACLLDDLRSHDTLWPDGVWRRNEKFSSMGNGFTFELESLIFYALCSSVTSSVSVFGDDIILPTAAYSDAQATLEFAGFDLNTSKSFSGGPFRESCGTDAYLGVNVTPFYLKRLPRRIRDVVKFHNGINEWATRKRVQETRIVEGRQFTVDYRVGHACVVPLLLDLQHYFPAPMGPQGFGDGHYHVPKDRARPRKAGYWLEGYWYETEDPVYPDYVLGELRDFNPVEGSAAILAALGPRRPKSIWDTLKSQQNVYYRSIRTLCQQWPEYVWA